MYREMNDNIFSSFREKGNHLGLKVNQTMYLVTEGARDQTA